MVFYIILSYLEHRFGIFAYMFSNIKKIDICATNTSHILLAVYLIQLRCFSRHASVRTNWFIVADVVHVNGEQMYA